MKIEKKTLKQIKAEKLKNLLGGAKDSETKVKQEKHHAFYHS